MSRIHRILFVVIFVAGFGLVDRIHAQDEKITFDDHVKPIFRQRCVTCHNTSERSADLDLSNYTAMMQGGASGSAIEPGDVAGSYLYALVNHDDEPAMPPDSDPIPSPEIAMIAKWIEGGALENQGSKFTPRKRNNLAMAAPATGRPEVIPVPSHLVREPVVVTKRRNASGPIATSPWAPILAVGGEFQILLYDTKTQQLTGVLPFPEGRANVLKFSRNGSLLLAGGGHDSASGRVVVYDVKSGKRVIEVGDELDTVLAADISSDHQLIALGGPQKIVRVYSTETGEVKYELEKHTDWIYSLEFSPDGVLLATGDRNGGLFVWEAMTGREYLSLRGHSKAISSVSWRLDSNVLASGSEDASIKLWEMVNGNQIKSWGAHGGGVQSVEFARDARIVSCGRDRTAKLWKPDGSGLRTLEAFSDIALAVSICDETDTVIAGDWTGAIRSWNAADGKRITEFEINPPKIDQRIASLSQKVNAEKQAFEPIQAAFENSNTKLKQLQSEVAAATAESEMLATRIEKMQSEMTSSTNLMKEKQQQTQVLDSAVKTLQSAAPMLVEAAEKNRSAAQALGDESLLQLATQLAEAAQQKTTELKNQQELLNSTRVDYEAAKNRLAQIKVELAELQQSAKANQTRMGQLMPQLKPTEEALAKAKESHDVAKEKLVSFESQLAFWQSEAEFAAAFTKLKAQQKAADQALLAAEKAAFEKREESAVAQASVNEQSQILERLKAERLQTMQDNQSLIKSLDALKQQLVNSQGEKTKMQQQAKVLSEKIQAIAPLVSSSNQVSTKFPEDQSLALAAKQLSELLSARKNEQSSLTEQLQQRDLMLTKISGEIEMTSMKMMQGTEQLENLALQVQHQESKLNDAAQLLAAKQKAVSEGEAAVEQANAEVARLAAERMQLQGIE